jgi:hypothetical protein
VARLTRPAPNSISERGGFGLLSGINAEDINVTEATSKKLFRIRSSIQSILSQIAEATSMPKGQAWQWLRPDQCRI